MGRNAICIVIDGLRASALGAYGNTSFATPALDSFAAHSVVCDWMYCDGPTTDDFYRAVWAGRAVRPKSQPAQMTAESTLPGLLGAAGIRTTLITDEGGLPSELVASYAEGRLVEGHAAAAAESVGETALARLFAVALDELQAPSAGLASNSPDTPSTLFWLHARGFHGPWDAPINLRAQLLADDELDAPTFVAPPIEDPVIDHDELLKFRCAYAAQAIVLDHCIAALIEAIADQGAGENTLVIVAGSRGYALGEHGFVGTARNDLYSEGLHVPCLLRPPGPTAPLQRFGKLCQPLDLHHTLLRWLGIRPPPGAAPAYDLLADHASSAAEDKAQAVVAVAPGDELMLRTRDWMLRRRGSSASPDASAPAASGAIELYAKPDDRWEFNEIASRRPDAATSLQSCVAQWEGQPGDLPISAVYAAQQARADT